MADELFPVCSPALLQGDKPLRCPEDLAHHTLLQASGGYDDDWRLWLTAAGLPVEISRQSSLS
ncbi:LysR substrate-binding domain-containing protein, partial [Escherichia coli]